MNRKNVSVIVISVTLLLLGLMQVSAQRQSGFDGILNLDLSTFLPVTLRNYFQTTTFPSGTLVVFNSSQTTTGNAGGRSGMNAICAATDPNSHFCTKGEIENAFNTTGVYFATPFMKAWMDEPALDQGQNWFAGYSCLGWGDPGNTLPSGRVIFQNGERYDNEVCTNQNFVACCSFTP